MRRFSISCICLLTALTALVGATVADADVHIGSAVPPAASHASACVSQFVYFQATSDPAIPYTAPPGHRKLTRWEVSTADGTAGAPVTLVILRPARAGSYDVLAADTETLPSPLPADEVASFIPASPIRVSGGEVLGLYAPTSGVDCIFDGGATPAAASFGALEAQAAPTPGQTLAPFVGESLGGITLNVAATLHGDQDVGVTTAASPAHPTVGALALLRSTVTNHGLESDPVTFTDSVPSGLTVDSVFAGPNSCATAGQTVTCTIDGLAVGQSAPVSILVTPTAAGSHVNTVSVAPQAGTADPVTADDRASATLTVRAVPPASARTKTPRGRTAARACVVPNLRRLTLATARRLLAPLGCKVGKVRRAHNRRIAKGAVIGTSPKPGTYAAGRRVALVVSSGPPRHRRHARG
jgi:hypothetical protein